MGQTEFASRVTIWKMSYTPISPCRSAEVETITCAVHSEQTFQDMICLQLVTTRVRLSRQSFPLTFRIRVNTISIIASGI